MNYKITISYNGSEFYGFAKQNYLRTVEYELEQAFLNLFNIKVKINASGRTDRYVHAINQIVNVNNSQLNYEPEIIENALNSFFNKDLYVKKVEIVNDNFHARFSAKNKTYIYKLNINNIYDPINAKLIYQYNKPINVQLFDEYKKIIIGKHNFLSFSTSELDNTIREIYEFDLYINDDIVEFMITGNGFLRNMVRMIIGVYLDLCENKIDLSFVYKLLNEPKKGSAIRKVDGCGLYLYQVNYL